MVPAPALPPPPLPLVPAPAPPPSPLPKKADKVRARAEPGLTVYKRASSASLDRLIDERYAIYEPSPERKYPPISLDIRNCTSQLDAGERKALNDMLPDWSTHESVIPLDFEPTKENVTQVLIEIQRKAGF